MSFSLAELALRMDPLDPPGSLRLLAERHRWVSLPGVLSFNVLLARHTHPETTDFRMLWYNTYLIHGFQIQLCNAVVLARLAEKARLDVREAVLKLALDPGDVVEALGITDWTLVTGMGFDLSDLKDKFSDVVEGIVSVITLGTVDVSMSDILDKVTPRDLIDRFNITVEDLIDQVGIDPVEILKAFCDQAIALFESIFGFGLDASFYQIGAAPLREERSQEIGTMVGQDYHLASLCEVFEPDKQANVDSFARASGRAVHSYSGPGQEGELASSGLQTLLLDRGPAVTDHIVFSYQGDRLRDADAWSRKGVLRTLIDVGVGKLELYSTHLFNGGGAVEVDGSQWWHAAFLAVFPPISAEERLQIQLDQIRESVQFIAATHEPQNIAMLVGDFNIDANEPSDYGALVAQLTTVDLVDLWPFWTQGGAGSKPPGDTAHPETPGVCATPDAPFCTQPPQQQVKTTRIDYIFVQRPMPEHEWVLDLTRIRRRAFQRHPESFLSDHLGLDVSLICSPKFHVPA